MEEIACMAMYTVDMFYFGCFFLLIDSVDG